MAEDFLPVDTYELVGGELCLDFVNTASGRREGPLHERLNEYDDLVTWGERLGYLSAERGAALRREAALRLTEAGAVLERGRELREAVYRTFSECCRESPPSAGDLAVLSREHAEASREKRLVATGSGFAFAWPDDHARLEQVLWPVATSAAELLTSGERSRVKECATDNCNWLFLDVSKNRSRRWCDMKDCGNRAKARRHYARRKSHEAH